MNTSFFQSIAKVISTRRPAWKFVVEDSMLRILTQQFIVDWAIIDEILHSGDYELFEVVSHNTLGIVICIKYTAGK